MHSIDEKGTIIVQDMEYLNQHVHTLRFMLKAIKNESLWLVVPLIL